ncbi:MAG: GNAT family N-acetyltransferase [Clostridia bacterium]|nr:GNAT family N-acetyltransferase [Clostridia bacterium]
MNIELSERTRECAITYFQKTRDPEIQALIPQKAQTLEAALADYELTLLPNAKSYGKSIFADGVHVGDIWCYCIGEEDPDAMLSFCVFEKRLWNGGIATIAATRFLAEIKDRFSLRSVGAFTYTSNAASIRVLQKLGFTERERFIENGMESVYLQLDFSSIGVHV